MNRFHLNLYSDQEMPTLPCLQPRFMYLTYDRARVWALKISNKYHAKAHKELDDVRRLTDGRNIISSLFYYFRLLTRFFRMDRQHSTWQVVTAVTWKSVCVAGNLMTEPSVAERCWRLYWLGTHVTNKQELRLLAILSNRRKRNKRE